MKITTITSYFKIICLDKPPIPSDVFHDVNTPIECINTSYIDDIGGSNLYNLKDLAKCSTLSCLYSWEMNFDSNFNNRYVPRNAQAYCQ